MSAELTGTRWNWINTGVSIVAVVVSFGSARYACNSTRIAHEANVIAIEAKEIGQRAFDDDRALVLFATFDSLSRSATIQPVGEAVLTGLVGYFPTPELGFNFYSPTYAVEGTRLGSGDRTMFIGSVELDKQTRRIDLGRVRIAALEFYNRCSQPVADTRGIGNLPLVVLSTYISNGRSRVDVSVYRLTFVIEQQARPGPTDILFVSFTQTRIIAENLEIVKDKSDEVIQFLAPNSLADNVRMVYEDANCR